MKKSNDSLFLILGAVMYVWAIVVFANYLMQSLWIVSGNGSLMIETVELFF